MKILGGMCAVCHGIVLFLERGWKKGKTKGNEEM